MAKPPAPDRPPKLADMAARRTALEKARLIDFPKWKQALEDARGNVTEAGVAVFPDLPRKKARDAANRQIRRLGLVEHGAKLRLEATGRSGAGRPPGKK